MTRTLTIALLAACLAFACSSNKKSKHYLPPLEVEVPEALKGNDEAEAFVEATCEAINQWSNSFEDLAIEAEEFVGVEEEDLSAFDKIKLVKIMGEFMVNMGEFALKCEEIEKQSDMIKDGLSEEELQAFESIKLAFDQRIEELGEKYKDYGTTE